MALSKAHPVKRKRVPAKRAPPRAEAQDDLPDFAAEERADARKCAYLVTLPHPNATMSSDGFRLVAPENLSRQTVLEKFLDACERPLYLDMKSQRAQCQVHPIQCGIFRESHRQNASGEVHEHDHLLALAE